MNFFVPLEKPIGKARPRFTRTGRPYTPKATHDAEKLIRLAYQEAVLRERIDQPRIDRPKRVSVTITAIYPIPKSWPKYMRVAAAAGQIVPAVKPDIDNVIKLVLDALNGFAYEDDSQVSAVQGEKLYAYETAPSPGLIIDVEAIQEEITS